MSVVEQCPGCGDDIVIKRGNVEGRMCLPCQRKARATKPAPEPIKPSREPVYDALGFCTGYRDVVK